MNSNQLNHALCGLVLLRSALLATIALSGQVCLSDEKEPAATVAEERRAEPRSESPRNRGARLQLNFETAPWPGVLKTVADELGLTLDAGDVPPGTFTYRGDLKKYTPLEALDVLNGYLIRKAFILVQNDKFLVVVNVNHGVPTYLIPRVSLDELPKRGRNELVSVVIELPGNDAQRVAEQTLPLLGPVGRAEALNTQLLLLRDFASNLQQIQRTFDLHDARATRQSAQKGPPAEAIARDALLTRTGSAPPRDPAAGAGGGSLAPAFIPSGLYTQGRNVIVARNEAGDMLWGYSDTLGKWTQHGVATSGKPLQPPTVGDTFGIYWNGERAYAYSARMGRWSEISSRNGKPIGPPAISFSMASFRGEGSVIGYSPTTGRWDELRTTVDQVQLQSDKIVVEDQGQVHVFSDATGRWSSTGDSAPGGGNAPDVNLLSPFERSARPLVDAAGRPIDLVDRDNGELGVVVAGSPQRSDIMEYDGTGKTYEVRRTLSSAGDLLRALRAQTAETERETNKLVDAYRAALASKNDQAAAQARTQLETHVRQTFERRQNAQRLEAEILRHRLQQVDTRLEQREGLKDRIIERRTQELLSPELNWGNEQGGLGRTAPGGEEAKLEAGRPQEDANRESADVALADDAKVKDDTKKAPARTPYPRIVKTVPEAGATDVEPGQKNITITFDRDMGKGMSWTGNDWMPGAQQQQTARWINARTCVLPVVLESGNYYRVGINSTSFQNFRSAGGNGVPVPPTAVWFATKGATDEVKARVKVPQIAAIVPENGAKDVDPATAELRVTFDVPMGAGMSWTGGGPKMPRARDPVWSEDDRTCTLPVALEPGRDYELGINSLSASNFQSRWGVPLEPVVYKFRTRDVPK